MNLRIKKVRKTLDLTQQVFAERIGLKQNSIALIESGKRNISDQALLSICREFNVREEWLRKGIGEMFKPDPSAALDALAEEYKLTHSDYILVKKFVNLKEEKRLAIADYILDVAASLMVNDDASGVSAAPASTPSIDEKVEAYRQALEFEQRAAEKSEVS